MIGEERLRWLLTGMFAAATVIHLLRWAGRGGQAGHRLAEALHAIMGAAMIVMVWPWGAAVPAAVWITVFTVSASWFTMRAVRSVRRRNHNVFFATTTAAMVWMAVWMPAGASSGHAGHGTGTDHALPGYAVLVTAALGTYLVAAAVWWAGRGLHIGALSAGSSIAVRQPPRWSALCHATMSAGMGLAFLAMA